MLQPKSTCPIARRVTSLSTDSIKLIGSVCNRFPNLLALRVQLHGSVEAYHVFLSILRNAPSLEHLDVHILCHDFSEGKRANTLLPSLQSIRLTLASFDNLNVLKNLRAPAIKSLFLSAPTDPLASAFWDAAFKFIQASPQLVKLEMYDVFFLDDTLTKKGGMSEDRSSAFRDFLSALSNVRILKLGHFDITIILQSISAAAEWRIFPSLTHLESDRLRQ
ncbi:hypothetical protein M422DRAFT_277249 [Sphaerobolus stellatus SS14]|uniref:Uncharacterized protein n=1 Tax=Sphaerobolus stellatus (strain SS14) TaxID=990650 RepID=A0A0C9U9Y3_SPHS4|nr:hypothetical protein M422DRAFT_277249 [Sphaerobolus stellatus SS14]